MLMDATEVRCPYCYSVPGQPCISERPPHDYTKHPHRERVTEWREWIAEENK